MTPRSEGLPDAAARIAVVVPAADEASRVARVIETMPERIEWIVLVDDASTDGTADVARSVGDRRLSVIRHRERRGVGAAIEAGYRRGFSMGADICVVMAGDGQMDPADLDALVAPVERGEAGYAKGDRLDHPRAAREMPLVRRLAGIVLSAATSAACGAVVRDSQCGYTAIDRASWERLGRRALWPSYGYPNDLLVRLARAGVRTRDVTVRPVYLGKRGGMGARHALLMVPYVIARALVLTPRSRERA